MQRSNDRASAEADDHRAINGEVQAEGKTSSFFPILGIVFLGVIAMTVMILAGHQHPQPFLG
ncbi:MAG TPA: hypothetical protein VEA92_00700 [Candidatus Paceibacterota bacterium]|nr:hypothetical protein [Candidatus Paceibacterota bacterium]